MARPSGDGNPCIALVSVPGADLATELAHSITLDAAGRLWYSVHGPDTAAGKASLGIALPDLSAIVRLPALPGAPADPLANDRIAIDPTTGDLWIAEYFRHRLGRLRRIRAARAAAPGAAQQHNAARFLLSTRCAPCD